MPSESQKKRACRVTLAAAMVAIGILHFARPAPFVAIVPPYLPAPLLLVWVSGFFEIAGGVGLLVARVHRLAAWGLVALYVAVFPANVHMAVHEVRPEGMEVSTSLLWLRLPLQIVPIALAVWLSRSPRYRPSSTSPT
jgi:uncharacterized membrane protein